MNWIERVVEIHKEFESPLKFWEWSAAAAISAVVKDNVYIEQGMYRLYPNIYVMLHADSGLKKGPSVNFARRVVDLVGNTRIIRGRSSIQGILQDLSRVETAPNRNIADFKTACGFICWSEFSAALVSDPAAMNILTDLYDRNYNYDNYTSLLKSEKFEIKNPCITMLTATNQAHAASFFESKDVAGGFFARTFIIYEKEENTVNSLLVLPEEEINYELMAEHLKCLSKLRGPFSSLGSRIQSDLHTVEIFNAAYQRKQFFTPAGAVYQDWYPKFKEQTRGIEDPTGTLNRFGTSVLKVAMIYSLAEKAELHISESAMISAIAACEKLVGNIRKVTVGKTEADSTAKTRKVLLIEELYRRENHTISRLQLHQKYWLQGTHTEWDDTCVACKEAGLLVMVPLNGSVVYIMPPEMVDKLKNFYSGKVGEKDE